MSRFVRSHDGLLVTSRSVSQLEPSGSRIDPVFRESNSSGKESCWLVRPNPMVFENIGFSKAVTSADSQGPSCNVFWWTITHLCSVGPQKKFLSCADCDIGPLGWCHVGGSDFWLILDRVGYWKSWGTSIVWITVTLETQCIESFWLSLVSFDKRRQILFRRCGHIRLNWSSARRSKITKSLSSFHATTMRVVSFVRLVVCCTRNS